MNFFHGTVAAARLQKRKDIINRTNKKFTSGSWMDANAIRMDFNNWATSRSAWSWTEASSITLELVPAVLKIYQHQFTLFVREI